MSDRGRLSEYFTGVVSKRLSAVEASPHRSNQHEFNGVKPLKDLLGNADRRDIAAQFFWLADEDESLVAESGFVSWYDARAAHLTRTEHRLYFAGTSVTDNAAEGDLLVVALSADQTIKVIVAKRGSTVENQILWLFGLPEPEGDFQLSDTKNDTDVEIGFAARFILDELGVDVVDEDAELKSKLLERFGTRFPRTDVFSKFARSSLNDVPVIEDPDEALMMWVNQEERLFRMMEREILGERLRQGFLKDGTPDVDSFISVSLSVQNRRKSRAGYALENHLEAILIEHRIAYSREQETENRSKPDFLFPGIDNYRDGAFEESKLTMLGVKSSCKDRWRQVLSESQRIKNKHLLTLEPGISENQTNEMAANYLNLVVPKGIHTTYKEAQRDWLLNVSNFLDVVRDRHATD